MVEVQRNLVRIWMCLQDATSAMIFGRLDMCQPIGCLKGMCAVLFQGRVLCWTRCGRRTCGFCESMTLLTCCCTQWPDFGGRDFLFTLPVPVPASA